MALLLLVAWIYNFISKSLQNPEPDPYHCDYSTMSEPSPMEFQPSIAGSPISSAWTTPDRNNNSVSSMEDGENANAAEAMNTLVGPIFSPFDFRNTRTPEEMALFDRFGDDYEDVVTAMDAEEQHDLKRAIRFEVPNHPTVSAAYSDYI